MKAIKFLSIGLVFSAICLTACNNGDSTDESGNTITYSCPMKCEGEKTYTEEGSCPVCGMDLVKVE